ncbi:MAG: HAD family phosphatase [Flavobacteriaceae bacterium]|nr:HAD family phosphatase [Flavobacteriaceae bacterium]
MLQLPKIVLFDMDGTLVDNYAFHLKAWQHICERRGKTKTLHEIATDLHGTNFEICRKFFGQEVTIEQSERIGTEKEALYREIYAPFIKPVNGLYDFLTALKQQSIKLALGTMGNRANAAFILKALALEEYFTIVQTAEDVSRGKPHPDIFDNCLNLLEFKAPANPTDVWVFEDTSSGIKAALNTGAKAMGICTSKSAQELLESGAHCVFKDYQEVLTKTGLT